MRDVLTVMQSKHDEAVHVQRYDTIPDRTVVCVSIGKRVSDEYINKTIEQLTCGMCFSDIELRIALPKFSEDYLRSRLRGNARFVKKI